MDLCGKPERRARESKLGSVYFEFSWREKENKQNATKLNSLFFLILKGFSYSFEWAGLCKRLRFPYTNQDMLIRMPPDGTSWRF